MPNAPADIPACDIVNIADASMASALTEQYGYPFLSEAISQIFSAQSDQKDVQIRWFQKQIIEQGRFFITSPRTGEQIPSADAIILPDRTIFYRFQDDPDLLLASSDLGRGYPIVALLIRSKRLLIQLGEPIWGVTENHIPQVEAILSRPEFHKALQANEIGVFTGDSNFAHHIWNHLGALNSLCDIARPALPLTIKATFTPLGPLHELFPELKHHVVSWSPSHICDDENTPGRVHINLGGSLVAAGVQKRVRKAARKNASRETRAEARFLSRHYPVIWISVRSRNRTADNQAEAIIALSQRLFKTYPKCAVVLDGYSTPFDITTNSNYHAIDGEIQIANDLDEATKIKNALLNSCAVGKSQRLTIAVGLPVLDSILLADTAGFSFCHHGTVQHKIGWTTNTPGVVHANRRTIGIDPGPWVSVQLENPPSLAYIPQNLVEDIDVEQSGNAETASRLFENYRFINIPALVDFVTENVTKNVLVWETSPAGARRFLSLWWKTKVRGPLRRLRRSASVAPSLQ